MQHEEQRSPLTASLAYCGGWFWEIPPSRDMSGRLHAKVSEALSYRINFASKWLQSWDTLSVRRARRVFGCDSRETDQLRHSGGGGLVDDAAIREKLNAVDNKLSRKSGEGGRGGGGHKLTCCGRLQYS